MRIGHVLMGRPDWYDRSPVEFVFQGAHDWTQFDGALSLWSYTVPSNKKTFLQMALAHLDRRGAAAVAGVLFTYVFHIVGASSVPIVLAAFIDNTIGAREDGFYAGAGAALAGTIIGGAGQTGDIGAGAHVFGYANAWMIEYDK